MLINVLFELVQCVGAPVIIYIYIVIVLFGYLYILIKLLLFHVYNSFISINR